MTDQPPTDQPPTDQSPTDQSPTDRPAPSATLPDRLSIDPRSPHHDAALLARGVGIRFNNQEKFNVEEYCVSEGWVRVSVGKTVTRTGQPMTMKLKGVVQPYLRDEAAPAAN